jgi:2-polyprenyl-6-methoxyphenol hydroxylase-like FAD-dependent oxidoreductase
VGCTTKESIFFTEHGQFVFSEPAGRDAGYDWPQFSIHRGDLQMVLLDAVHQRLGTDSGAVSAGAAWASTRMTPASPCGSMTARDMKHEPARGALAVGCDGIHSILRKQFYPNEGAPRYSGVNMWRGTDALEAFPVGGQHGARRLAVGRQDGDLSDPQHIDGQGRQLVNWVAEIEAPQPACATGAGVVASKTSSLPSPTGISTGWTCRR